MIRGKNMKSEQAIDIVEELGEDIPKGEKTIFKALVDDNKKMDQRMTALEKTVSEVKSDVKNIKDQVEDLCKKMDDFINKKVGFWNFLSSLITEGRFWVWLIVLTLLIFGVTETDLFKFLQL